MTAANHAARRTHKTALLSDHLLDLRALPGLQFFRVIRDESIIVGQIRDRPLLIAVKLPGAPVPDRLQEELSRSYANRGAAFIVRERGDLRMWITRLGL